MGMRNNRQLVRRYSGPVTEQKRDAHMRILSRSRGETTVLEAAPAHPPATKYSTECFKEASSAATREEVVVEVTGESGGRLLALGNDDLVGA